MVQNTVSVIHGVVSEELTILSVVCKPTQSSKAYMRWECQL